MSWLILVGLAVGTPLLGSYFLKRRRKKNEVDKEGGSTSAPEMTRAERLQFRLGVAAIVIPSIIGSPSATKDLIDLISQSQQGNQDAPSESVPSETQSEAEPPPPAVPTTTSKPPRRQTGPLQLRLSAPGEGKQYIDFDSERLSQTIDKESWEELTDEERDRFDLTYYNSFWGFLSPMDGSSVGILPEGHPLTADSCKNAAYGRPLTELDLSRTKEVREYGFKEDAVLCFATNEGNIVGARIDKIIDPDPSSTVGAVTVDLTVNYL